MNKIENQPPPQGSLPIRISRFETEKEMIRTIGEIAGQILFSVLAVALGAAILSSALYTPILPLIAISAVFLSGFFFQRISFHESSDGQPLPRFLDPTDVPTLPLSLSTPLVPKEIPLGIPREGNNCWLNTSLQMIWSDRLLREWFSKEFPLPPPPQEGSLEHELREYEDLVSFSNVHREFVHFFNNYEELSRKGDCIVESPSQPLREALSEISRIRKSHCYQEDAFEALAYLLRFFKGSLIRQTIRPEKQRDLPPILPEESYEERNQETSFQILELSIDESIPKMLESYCQDILEDLEPAELLGVDEKVHAYPFVKRITFLEAPPMLRLCLKRYLFEPAAKPTWFEQLGFFEARGGTIKKDHRSVSIPLNLELPLENEGRIAYRLKSFACHQGETPNSGHYVAYIRGERGEWFLANDLFIRSQTESEVRSILQSGEPYLLFYERNS